MEGQLNFSLRLLFVSGPDPLRLQNLLVRCLHLVHNAPSLTETILTDTLKTVDHNRVEISVLK